MADFSAAVAVVLANEGGASPSTDNNGATVRYGLNRAANPGLDPGFYDGTMPDAEALALAESVYRTSYWNVIGGDSIGDQVLATHLMDMAVNAGTGGAILLLQAALNTFATPDKQVAMDGGMGPATLGAVAKYAALGGALLQAYRDARVGYYVAESLRGNQQWLKPWLARVGNCG